MPLNIHWKMPLNIHDDSEVWISGVQYFATRWAVDFAFLCFFTIEVGLKLLASSWYFFTNKDQGEALV